MLKHDMLEVEMGNDQEAKKEDLETRGTPKGFLNDPTCTALKNCFRFDLCLPLPRVTRQTGVVRKPIQKLGSLEGFAAASLRLLRCDRKNSNAQKKRERERDRERERERERDGEGEIRIEREREDFPCTASFTSS